MQLPRLQVNFEQATVVTEQLASNINQLEANISRKMDELRLSRVPQTDANTKMPVLSTTTSSAVAQGNADLMLHNTVVSTPARSKRSSPCNCNCHAPTALRSPQWLGSAVGTLQISYSRATTGPCRPCSRRSCNHDPESLFQSRYYFPPWMLHRMLSLHCKWDALGGCTFALKTPRAVSSRSTVFTLAQHGNIGGMQRLFEQRLASPYDISIEEGRSALHVSGRSSIILNIELNCQYSSP